MDDESDLLPLYKPEEAILDISAAVASIAPYVGGPVSQVLSGASFGRKWGRVREVIIAMAKQIKDLRSEVTENYVKSDEFAELLEKALRSAADERSEEKRQAYAAFLAGAVANPGDAYSEKERILRTLDQLQADHIRMLKAMLEPARPTGSMLGAISQTLQRRLPGMGADHIRDLAQQLTDLRLATLEHMNTMMTPDGAAHLENYITPYGNRVIAYIFQEGT